MADVTINELTKGTPAGNNLVPYSTGSVTLGTPVSAIFQNVGNIGINTTNIPSTLTVNGDMQLLEYGKLNFSSTAGASYINAPQSDHLALYTAGVQRMRIDSTGNVGIGLLPNAWGTTMAALQLGGSSCIWSDKVAGLRTFYGTNYYYDGTNRKYIAAGAATEYLQAVDGAHVWYNATAGAAAATVTFTERLRIDANGRVGIGTSTPTAKLDVVGDVKATNTPKAWVNFDGINGSVVGGEFRCNILRNYNIDRVVRTSTGRYTVYFATPAPDAYYVVTGACNYNNANTDSLTIFTVGSQYASYCQVVSRGYGSTAGYYDPSSMHVVIHY